MSSNLSVEIFAVVLTALFTGLLWIPIIGNRLVENGLWPALKNPQPDVRPRADWADRLAHAHRNAIEIWSCSHRWLSPCISKGSAAN